MKNRIKQFFSKIKSFFSSLGSKLIELSKTSNGSELLNLVLTILPYGFFINIVATGLFGLRFSMITVLSYGLLFWFVKEEIPEIIKGYMK